MQEQKINFYRINLILGSILIPVFWLEHHFVSPNGFDPLPLRLLVVIPAVIAVIVSYVSKGFHKYMRYIFYEVIFSLVIWLSFIVYMNKGGAEYIISQFVWFIIFATYFESFLSLSIFSVFLFVLAGVSVFLLPHPEISKTFYLLMLVSGLSINFISLLGKVKLTKTLRDKTEELDKFKLIVQNAGEHIIITDKDGKVIFANDAVTRITGYSNREIIGQRPSLWGRQMPAGFYDKMWDTIKNKKQRFTGEINNRRKNGEIYVAEADIAPILDINGDVEFFVGIERDVTEQRRSQQEITDKVKELNRINSLMVGREMKMIELKKEIAKLKGDK